MLFLVIALPLYAAVLWRAPATAAPRRVGRRVRRGAAGRGRARAQRLGAAGGEGQRPLRGVARRVARAWCMATAPLRRPPDILVLGTKRGGSTSLAAYRLRASAGAAAGARPPRTQGRARVRRTPGARPVVVPVAFRDGVRARHGRATADGSRPSRPPTTCSTSEQAARARRPGAGCDARSCCCAIRCERAWSHWRERTRRGLETLSFEEALAAEDERLADAAAQRRARTSPIAPRAVTPTSFRRGRRPSETGCWSCSPKTCSPTPGGRTPAWWRSSGLSRSPRRATRPGIATRRRTRWIRRHALRWRSSTSRTTPAWPTCWASHFRGVEDPRGFRRPRRIGRLAAQRCRFPPEAIGARSSCAP